MKNIKMLDIILIIIPCSNFNNDYKQMENNINKIKIILILNIV